MDLPNGINGGVVIGTVVIAGIARSMLQGLATRHRARKKAKRPTFETFVR